MPRATKASQPKTTYICDNCGATYPRWQGQCDQCHEWNTLVETVVERSSTGTTARSMYGADAQSLVVSAHDALQQVSQGPRRLSTHMYELDRVYGGGVVFGSVSLVGGEPGIGKSTLSTQSLVNILIQNEKMKSVYLAGEESPQQISQRLERIAQTSDKPQSSKTSADDEDHRAVATDWSTRLRFYTGSNVDHFITWLREEKPDIAVIDSIQTLVTGDLTGMAGSVGQLREVSYRLVATAKQLNIPMILIGHVTKEGEIAGPKVIEHIVDTVLQITGERTDDIRVVRALKNRFGPTDEVGLFRLVDRGVEEISNPAEVFLDESHFGQPGAARALCLEGSRPVVVEVQALTVSSYLPSPRRVARGIPIAKLHLLLAVLQKHAKLDLSSHDVYVNVVGSLDFKDPGIDLAVAAAVMSAKTGKPPEKNAVYCGEIGLLGEVRRVSGLEKRRKEAKHLGYEQVIDHTQLKRVGQLQLSGK